MQNNSVSLSLPLEKVKKIISFYSEFKKDNSNEYVEFFAQDEVNELTISVYKPRKNKALQAVVFQGPKAEYEASIWSEENKQEVKKEEPRSRLSRRSLFPQIGSDEVGTGDFFGPISVCAAFVTKEDLDKLNKLGVTDSKKLRDEKILEIGPKLIKQFTYSQLLLDNEKYNEVHDEYNMNAIKAKMHNRCILNVKAKKKNAYIYQDQFAKPITYFSYLKNEKEVERNIVFSTKGESKYPSIALASCIARYSFLKNMEALSKKYKEDIPFGASSQVIKFAVRFAKKHGIEELDKIVKKNFVTYQKVLEELNK